VKNRRTEKSQNHNQPLEPWNPEILEPFLEVSSLYIHIPFCLKKCSYCDFFSVPYDASSAHAYTDALCKELYLKSKIAHRLTTVYIGGGTPSLLPDKCFSQIFSCLGDNFQISHDAEISVEANPGTLNESKVNLLLSLGVNRMSLGVQSFNDDELNVLGRIHTADDALRSLGLIRNAGLQNYSLDLIYGIPGQSMDSWRESIVKAVDCSPMHISTYELTLEEGTPLYALIKLQANEQFSYRVAKGQPCHSGLSGIFLRENGFPTSGNDTKKTIDHPYSKTYIHNLLPMKIPPEDIILDMYNHTIDYLQNSGYKHYEISNFALHGFQCLHNLNYWDRGGYIGAGAGAHSFVNGIRSHNVKDIHDYSERLNNGLIPETEVLKISPAEALKEFLFLGLRKRTGISICKTTLFGVDIISACKEMLEAGYFEVKDDSLRLTRNGIVLSNSVIVRLFGNLGL
jgi:oxygen-independent coproporphyrinogen-3 oxidase